MYIVVIISVEEEPCCCRAHEHVCGLLEHTFIPVYLQSDIVSHYFAIICHFLMHDWSLSGLGERCRI